MDRILTAFSCLIALATPHNDPRRMLGHVLQPTVMLIPVAAAGSAEKAREGASSPFVWPKTVAEFYAFDPNYLDKWLISRSCPLGLVEDFRQDLFAYLCSPSTQCVLNGLPDKMGLYNPELRGNAVSIAAWANWLSKILERQYWKLINKNKRGCTTGPNIVSLTEDEVDLEGGLPTWWMMMAPEERVQFQANADEVYSGVTSGMLMHELLDTLHAEVGAEARDVLAAVAQTDTITQAAELLGWRPKEVHKTLKHARYMLSCVLGIQAKELLVQRAVARVALTA